MYDLIFAPLQGGGKIWREWQRILKILLGRKEIVILIVCGLI